MRNLLTACVAAAALLSSASALQAQCPKATEYKQKLSAGEGHHYSYASHFEILKCQCQAGVA